jgi:quercetin dioxygenase-like cupin family protein
VRSSDTTGHPAGHLPPAVPASLPALDSAAAPAPSPARLVELTARLAASAGSGGRSPGGPTDRAWSVPLLVTLETEVWLLGWPAGLVAPAHDHRGATVALTVVEGTLSEECLDPTIWTTGRRTTWRAGATTLFPPGHVHLLGAAGDRPAVAVHAWSGPAGSAGRGAGRLALGRGAAVAGGGAGRGRGAAQPVGVGQGRRGGHACLPGHPADGALDLGHVRDRVAG